MHLSNQTHDITQSVLKMSRKFIVKVCVYSFTSDTVFCKLNVLAFLTEQFFFIIIDQKYSALPCCQN